MQLCYRLIYSITHGDTCLDSMSFLVYINNRREFIFIKDICITQVFQTTYRSFTYQDMIYYLSLLLLVMRRAIILI